MSKLWFTRHAGKVSGPFTGQQLKSSASTGKISPSTEISQAPDGPWHLAERVMGAGLFQDAAKSSSAAIAPPLGQPMSRPPAPSSAKTAAIPPQPPVPESKSLDGTPSTATFAQKYFPYLLVMLGILCAALLPAVYTPPSQIRGEWVRFSDFWRSEVQPVMAPGFQALQTTAGRDDAFCKQVFDEQVIPSFQKVVSLVERERVSTAPVVEIKNKAVTGLKHMHDGLQLLSDAIAKGSPDLAAEGKRRLGRGDELLAELRIAMNAMSAKYGVGVTFD